MLSSTRCPKKASVQYSQWWVERMRVNQVSGPTLGQPLVGSWDPEANKKLDPVLKLTICSG